MARLFVHVDPVIAEKARDVSAATGHTLASIVSLALASHISRMEAEHGEFPQRAHKYLPKGPGRGGRRAPMVAEVKR
jgi:hypothetical protein